MKNLNCYDIEELCECVNDSILSISEDKFVSVIAKYDEAKEILQELVYYDYKLRSIELENPEFYDYEDEYEISVAYGDIYCAKFKTDDGYLNSNANIVYVLDNVNSKVIKHLHDATMLYEVHIGDYEDECCDECEEECGLKDNKYNVRVSDDQHGFTLSKATENGYESYSFYSSELPYVTDMLNSLSKIFKL